MASNHDSASLGVLGRYYSARHTLGQYGSACVVASYSILGPDNVGLSAPTRNLLQFALERCIQRTIRQHPGLCYGVSDETNAGIPLFTQLDYINRRDVLEVIDARHVSGPTEMDNTTDVVLNRVLGERHANLWLNNRPAWKVVVIEHIHSPRREDPENSGLARLDIVFFAHHAIADGLSGIAFHASLMEAFQNISELSYPPTWPMVFTPKDSPPAVEERVNCLPCGCTICSSPSICEGPVWAGNPISPAPLINFKSMVRILSISAESLSDVLKRCKLSNITLTGLLHALICTSLCRRVKGVPGIRAVTPFSVRKLTNTSAREIVNHISFLTTYVPGTELSKIVGNASGSTVEEQHVIQLAQHFSNDITTKVKQFPHGSMFTNLSGVKDFLSLCQSQAGTERLYTYELSNLGSASSIPIQPSNHLKLDKLVFTQCGMVAGPAMSFNCASVRGGSLTISITWERGVVEESLIEQVAQDLEHQLNHEGS
ncbi:hypothetical protein BHE90_002741 [Fusarium euwallaceae]|uniref:Alcohol acetyltransferase FCK4 n=1 Tax=Fusarium euwallaceae TaxID=1147111 RepID=A0A430M4I6_9HYPO|nr:hypothetical protein BHE90_002741 [Fusarium euwallaceae]